jgi:hypothetical protein
MGGDGHELGQKRTGGRAGRFKAKPAILVSARQFQSLGVNGDFGVALDTSVTRDVLEIQWECPKGPIYHQEIPFMVIGEVPDPRQRGAGWPGHAGGARRSDEDARSGRLPGSPAGSSSRRAATRLP